jgi:hypothetical protein
MKRNLWYYLLYPLYKLAGFYRWLTDPETWKDLG